MYSAADLRKGLKIILDNDPYIVIAFDFTKPGKGQALYRTKMRNIRPNLPLGGNFRASPTRGADDAVPL